MNRLVISLLAVLLTIAQSVWAEDTPQNFVLYGASQLLPDFRFQDSAGKPLGLSSFRGKIVLLNIWATWCGPCRKEMPTLDRLQAKLGGTDFAVVPLSIDQTGMGTIESFYHEFGIEHLGKYLDADGEAASRVNTIGVPTTLLIDRQGRELGRLVGPAEWDSPDMIAFLQGVIARKPAP